MPARQPTFYIPHGGGPCFFMPDPEGRWASMERFLRDLPVQLPERPRAILIVSGHWETDGFAFTGTTAPPLIFDYYGFPAHTYDLTWPAPGAPWLAERARDLVAGAGLRAVIDPDRGIDHGVFVPLKVAFPDAEIPVVEMSLDRGLDPAFHIAAGSALAPLRDEGVLIVGAGMSFHNMQGYGRAESTAPSQAFDTWLTEALAEPSDLRWSSLIGWADAPAARIAHPREEHLLPLFVAAGAGGTSGQCIYGDLVLKTAISAYRFG